MSVFAIDGLASRRNERETVMAVKLLGGVYGVVTLVWKPVGMNYHGNERLCYIIEMHYLRAPRPSAGSQSTCTSYYVT